MPGWGRSVVREGAGGVGEFFFSSRRRHTRFDCDWSSDVCSSDLESFAHGERDLSEPFPNPSLQDLVHREQSSLLRKALAGSPARSRPQAGTDGTGSRSEARRAGHQSPPPPPPPHPPPPPPPPPPP